MSIQQHSQWTCLSSLHEEMEQEQASEDAGEAGLIEPKGRQAASLCADDMIRAFLQQHWCVLGGLFLCHEH